MRVPRKTAQFLTKTYTPALSTALLSALAHYTPPTSPTVLPATITLKHQAALTILTLTFRLPAQDLENLIYDPSPSSLQHLTHTIHQAITTKISQPCALDPNPLIIIHPISASKRSYPVILTLTLTRI